MVAMRCDCNCRSVLTEVASLFWTNFPVGLGG
jgi:hypothetical protein